MTAWQHGVQGVGRGNREEQFARTAAKLKMLGTDAAEDALASVDADAATPVALQAPHDDTAAAVPSSNASQRDSADRG